MAEPLPLPHQGLILGLDHSRAATGVALGNLDLGTSRALTVLQSPKLTERLEGLARLYQEWTPVFIVLGLPLTENGEEQDQSRLVRQFAERLRERFSCPIVLHDERYSTVVAESDLKTRGLGHKAQREIIDAEAAREIIQGFLDLSHRHTHLRDPA